MTAPVALRPFGATEIRASLLGADAGSVGAAAPVLRHVDLLVAEA